MKIDLHNHTYRCNHATGTVDEYIKLAIDQGIEIYGFSEHAPMEFDEGYRLAFDEMIEYESDILQAKERYKDQIDIRLGYEVDWLPGYIDDRVLNADVDYLVGSVHFLDKWGFDNPEFIGEWQNRDTIGVWSDYFDEIAKMVESKLFDIVGHFDLIKVFGHKPDTDILPIIRPALEAIEATDMVVELNSAGLRKPIKELYPSLQIVQEAYKMGIDITFGSDAHAPDQVGYGLDRAYQIAKEAGYSQAVTFRDRKKELVKI